MRFKHILLKTPLLIDQVILSLRQGADFSALAREHSACPSAKNGGEIGEIEADDLPKAIQLVLRDLPLNEVSQPVYTHHGIHIIQLEAV